MMNKTCYMPKRHNKLWLSIVIGSFAAEYTVTPTSIRGTSLDNQPGAPGK